MDFIKGNEQVKIDPSGIDISGAGHIFMDSNSVTGDISFMNKVTVSDNFDVTGDISLNNKVSITNNLDVTGNSYFIGDISLTGDFSMNGKVSVTKDFDVTSKSNFVGDLSLNGNIEISSNDTFVITSEGKVGIGTSNPSCMLAVGSSTQTGAQGANNYIQLYKTWNHANAKNLTIGKNVPYSDPDSCNIFATDGLHIESNHSKPLYLNYFNSNGKIYHGGGEVHPSDKRIKKDIEIIDDDEALCIVNAIETKKYNYIDKTTSHKIIGFIAQEVKTIIPEAVTIIKKVVPDEMRIIAEPVWTQDASNNWLLEIPDLDMSGAFTGKARFYVSNDPSGNDKIWKEAEIKEVIEQGVLISNLKHFAIFDEKWNNVFFYGKEVSDFHTMDKNQIFALHHSAIQELDRKHKREVTEKNSKINNLEQLVENLTVRLESLESLVLSLQNN